MAKVIHDFEFNRKVCEMLGLDPSKVIELTISLDARGVDTFTVKQFVSDVTTEEPARSSYMTGRY